MPEQREHVQASACPDAESLAAYIDGRLSGTAREEIEAHMASCASCYETFVETVRLQGESGTGARVLTHRPFTTRTTLVTVGGFLATAAAIVLAVRSGWLSSQRESPSGRPELVELVAAVGTNRIVEPRLSGGFKWGPVPSALRSGEPRRELSPEIRIGIARIEQATRQARSADQFAALGCAHLIAGRPDEAIAALEKAAKDAPSRAEFHSDLAAAYFVKALERDPPNAEFLSRALDAASRATKIAPSLAEALFNRALALEKAAPPETSRSAWHDYLRVDSTSAWGEEARAHISRSSQHQPDGAGDAQNRFEVGDAAAADAFAATFPQAAREYLDEELLPNWGKSWLADDQPTAQRLLSQARRLADALRGRTGDRLPAASVVRLQASGDHLRELATGHVAYGAGRAFYDNDKYSEAAEAFDRAERELRRGASDFWIWASVQRALVSYQQRALDDAEHRLDVARALSKDREYSIVRARAQWLAGIVRLQRGDPALALDDYEEALRAFEQAGEVENEVSIHTTAADTLRILGDLDRGWDHVSIALSHRHQLRKPIRRYLLFLNASLFASKAGLQGAGIDFLGAAIDAARERGGPGPTVDALTRRARLYLEFGKESLAIRDVADARILLDRIPAPSLRSFFQARIHATEAMFAQTGSAQARESLTKALEFFARVEPSQVPGLYLSRGRRALSDGSADVAEHDLERGIETFEERRRRLPLEELRIPYSDEGWDLFVEMVKLQLDRGRPDRAFVYSERARARSLVERLTGDPGDRDMTPDDVLPRLTHETAMVYYVALDDRLLIWILRRDGVRLESVRVTREDLTQQIQRLVSAISNREPSERINDLGERLFELIIGSLRGELPEVLAFVPDGPLYDLPFAALIDPRSGRHLVEDHSIVITPSASLFAAHGERDRSWHVARAMVIGSSGTDNGTLSVLREAGAEATEVANLYSRSTLLQGGAATKDRFLAEAKDYEVIHFAGHAVSNPEYPWYSRLVFAADRMGHVSDLFAHEIAGMRFDRTRLVVLAACQTARGRSYRSEGVMSLARPFLAAGVSNVVATLWDVGDGATRAFSATFHHEFQARRDAAAALRFAQLSLMHSSRAELRTPDIWAGFTVLGTRSSNQEGTEH